MPIDMVFWPQESESVPENPTEFLLNRTRCVMEESGKVLSGLWHTSSELH